MSWESELGNTVKYGRWPNPFRNLVQDINVLACEDSWQAMFKMYAYGFGNWFFSNFIPSPYELTRKTFTGSYKCGFYSRIRIKSPLDVIWKDAGASRVLQGALRPVTTGLFYIWGMQTALDAIQTWSTIQYAMEMCDWDGNTTTLSEAIAPIQTNPSTGGVAFAIVVYDPRERAIPNDCIVRVPTECKWQAHVIGRIVAGDERINNISVGMTINDTTEVLMTHGTVAPHDTWHFAYSAQGLTDFLDIQPWFYAEPEQSVPGFGTIIIDRFIVNAFPPIYEWSPTLPLQVITPTAPSLCHYYE